MRATHVYEAGLGTRTTDCEKALELLGSGNKLSRGRAAVVCRLWRCFLALKQHVCKRSVELRRVLEGFCLLVSHFPDAAQKVPGNYYY